MNTVNNAVKRYGRLASWCAMLGAAATLVAACGTLRQTGAPSLDGGASIAVVSVANFTETPDAGLSAETIAANVLRTNGFADVRVAPADPATSSMFDNSDHGNREKKLEWARSQQIRYVLTGGVEEWRYKVGVDGEPAVGLTFELVDVETGKTVWSGTGSRTGWSRSGLANVANKLIGEVLAPVHAGS
jgi:polysaccharide biosynthesis protein PelC